MLFAMTLLMMAAQETRSPAACAQSDIVRMTPADTLQLLDDFRAALPVADRQRLDRALPRDADGGIAQCDTTEGSRASCEVAAYMPAFRSSRLMPQFLATICSKKS